MRLGTEDAVMNIYGPVSAQAAEEFEPAFAELRSQLGLGDAPLGLVGASLGAAVALSVLANGSARAAAAVLVSPLVQLRTAVDAIGRRFGLQYAWSEPSLAVAGRLDFVARAGEIGPPLLQIVGEKDEPEFHRAAAELREALGDQDKAELVTIPDEPGVEPAPQNEHAAQADAHAVRWLRRHLTA